MDKLEKLLKNKTRAERILIMMSMLLNDDRYQDELNKKLRDMIEKKQRARQDAIAS